jgi:hypothetical protein
MQPAPRSKVERVRTQSSFKVEGPRSAERFDARWREILPTGEIRNSRHAVPLTRPAPESHQTVKPRLMRPYC